MNNLKYVFYPGCNAEQLNNADLTATIEVCKKLGIELEIKKNMSCCGGTHLEKIDAKRNLELNKRNLMILKESNLDMLTICNTCTMVFSKSKYEILEIEKNSEISKDLKIKNFLTVIVDDFGLDNLKKHIVFPLTDIRVANFYGCHILRPTKYLEFEVNNYFERIIKIIGARSTDYDSTNDCCGFHIQLANKEASIKLNADNFSRMDSPDCIVTPCTLCHASLDSYQKEIGSILKKKDLNIPVLHLSQIIGLALGINSKKLGIDQNIVNTKDFLNKIQNSKRASFNNYLNNRYN